MINLKTDNPLLIAEREKAKNYLLKEVLGESIFNNDVVDDLINMAEARFGSLEINKENISLVYSKIYSPELKNALPGHLLKENNNLKIIK